MSKRLHTLLLASLAEEMEEEMEELMEHHQKEMHHGERKGGYEHGKEHRYEHGYIYDGYDMTKPHETSALSREIAGKWVMAMQNADGSVGAHWTMEQTTRVLEDRGLTFAPTEWWVTMNMVWSDYCKVGDKFAVGTVDFYADLAAAFLQDTDAKKGKLARYYWHIADPK